jgi:hypothetical protein
MDDHPARSQGRGGLMEPARVFVNYRRQDAAGSAGRLADDLARRLGPDAVFRDVKIRPGSDFVEEITARVGSCDAFLAVIGPRWLTVAKDGRRRLDDPGDYVRFEIETALRRDDVVVIPVLVEDAEMPSPDELPPSLRELARLNACWMRDTSWDHDLDRLAEALGDAPAPPPPDDVPGWGVAGAAVVFALGAGGLASLLTAGLVGKPDDGDPQARIAYYSAERSVVWALIGAAVLLGWTLAARRDRDVVGAALVGALTGAAGGVLSGVIYQGCKYLDSERDVQLLDGVLLRGISYLIPAAVIGYVFAGRGRWLQRSEGLLVGGAAGFAAAVLTNLNVWPTHGVALAGESAVVAAGLACATVAAARARTRPTVTGRVAVPV